MKKTMRFKRFLLFVFALCSVCSTASASGSLSSVRIDATTGEITSTDAGFMEPDEYYITVYEIGLCSSYTEPDTQNAIAYANSSVVYSNPTGMRVLVRNGVSTPNQDPPLMHMQVVHTTPAPRRWFLLL